jgi:dimethylamine/trimethylamine dehydrogenase
MPYGALHVVRSDTGEALPPIWGKTLLNVSARIPNADLYDVLTSLQQFEGRVTAIGDCVAPGIIQAAVFSGHHAARAFLGDVPQSGIYRRETPVLFA